tara:strand:- start:159 stop:890 length:732 start_codon:yes stop_codon:yes gene_type:complete
MNDSLRFAFVRKSKNRKLGPIPAVTVSSNTCSPHCPFYKNGCYALFSWLGKWWRALDERTAGIGLHELLARLRALPQGQIWRYAVAGDLPGFGDRIDASQLRQLSKASKHTKGFTFSHKPVLGNTITAKANRAAIACANAGEPGLTINLSADSLIDLDRKVALNIAPVVITMPSGTRGNIRTPAGNKLTWCPASTNKTGFGKVQCLDCGLCSWVGRVVAIAFRAHGPAKRKIDVTLDQIAQAA